MSTNPKVLFVDSFIGEAFWEPVGRLLRQTQVAYFHPQPIATFDQDVIARTTLQDLRVHHQGPLDLVVAADHSSGPVAHAVLGGLAQAAVIIDPPLVPLSAHSDALEEVFAHALESEEFSDLLERADPYSDELRAGRPDAALDAALGPLVTSPGEERFLSLMKTAMAERMPFDPDLQDESGMGAIAEDWVTPWLVDPSRVRLWVSQPSRAHLLALHQLNPGRDFVLTGWRRQMWLDHPETVAIAIRSHLEQLARM